MINYIFIFSIHIFYLYPILKMATALFTTTVYRASKTLDRLNKYIERGFTISNLDEFFECIEKLFED